MIMVYNSVSKEKKSIVPQLSTQENGNNLSCPYLSAHRSRCKPT